MKQGEYLNNQIAAQVPKLFSVLLICYTLLAFIGHTLLVTPSQLQLPCCICNRNQVTPSPIPVAMFLLREPLVWHIVTCFALTTVGGSQLIIDILKKEQIAMICV